MSFLKGFLSKKIGPNTEVQREIRMEFWKVHGCEVWKTIQYAGYFPGVATMRIELTCKHGALGDPLLFLTIRFAERLDAAPGYLSTRWTTDDADTGYSVVRLDHGPDDSTIIGKFERQAVAEITKMMVSSKLIHFWFGGEGGDLLRLPLPPEDGLEQRIEEAASHSSAYE